MNNRPRDWTLILIIPVAPVVLYKAESQAEERSPAEYPIPSLFAGIYKPTIMSFIMRKLQGGNLEVFKVCQMPIQTRASSPCPSLLSFPQYLNHHDCK